MTKGDYIQEFGNGRTVLKSIAPAARHSLLLDCRTFKALGSKGLIWLERDQERSEGEEAIYTLTELGEQAAMLIGRGIVSRAALITRPLKPKIRQVG